MSGRQYVGHQCRCIEMLVYHQLHDDEDDLRWLSKHPNRCRYLALAMLAATQHDTHRINKYARKTFFHGSFFLSNGNVVGLAGPFMKDSSGNIALS
jgi:hypothetical protein